VTHRKKPEPIKPLPVAIEHMYWRGKIVAEFLEGYDEHFSTQAKQAIQRWVVAITAYEASRDFKPAPPTVNAERKPS
jgi:hypothetical protein